MSRETSRSFVKKVFVLGHVFFSFCLTIVNWFFQVRGASENLKMSKRMRTGERIGRRCSVSLPSGEDVPRGEANEIFAVFFLIPVLIPGIFVIRLQSVISFHIERCGNGQSALNSTILFSRTFEFETRH